VHPPLSMHPPLESGGGTYPGHSAPAARIPAEREFFIGNLLVRIHVIIVMIRWTGLAPWEFEFPVPGSLTSTFLAIPPLLHEHLQRGRDGVRGSMRKQEGRGARLREGEMMCVREGGGIPPLPHEYLLVPRRHRVCERVFVCVCVRERECVCERESVCV